MASRSKVTIGKTLAKKVTTKEPTATPKAPTNTRKPSATHKPLSDIERLRRAITDIFKTIPEELDDELLTMIGIAGYDTIWEMSATVNREDEEGYDAIALQRFVDNIRVARRLPEISDVPSHSTSLVFESPYLAEERKADMDRDSLLLRKQNFVVGAIRCPRCDKNLIATLVIQTRAMDEPSTNFYTCGTCGHRWNN
jgi:DNA-directed RNA polymerase subunit M/transcription elongation factor TFIIS